MEVLLELPIRQVPVPDEIADPGAHPLALASAVSHARRSSAKNRWRGIASARNRWQGIASGMKRRRKDESAVGSGERISQPGIIEFSVSEESNDPAFLIRIRWNHRQTI
jgi:hypothetical protein